MPSKCVHVLVVCVMHGLALNSLRYTLCCDRVSHSIAIAYVILFVSECRLLFCFFSAYSYRDQNKYSAHLAHVYQRNVFVWNHYSVTHGCLLGAHKTVHILTTSFYFGQCVNVCCDKSHIYVHFAAQYNNIHTISGFFNDSTLTQQVETMHSQIETMNEEVKEMSFILWLKLVSRQFSFASNVHFAHNIQ